jgi:muconate cycloisomerase
MLEGAIGTSACAQLFSTFDSLRWGCQLFGPQLLLDDVASGPVIFEEFDVLVPDCIGLGVRLDADMLQFYTMQ